MSNVFISHSSQDKPFVLKLAISLLSKGFPVWLDSWRLEVGDSLSGEILRAIDASTLVLLVISAASNDSGWVTRELSAALTKEEQLKRKFLIPIRIDECELPGKLSDRLYADFSKSFSEPMQKLCDVLNRSGARTSPVSPEKELLALEFTRPVDLNKVAFEDACGYLAKRQPSLQLTERQVVFNADPQEVTLWERLHARIDQIASDPVYSPGLEEDLQWRQKSAQNWETQLRSAMAMLANNAEPIARNASLGDAAYWCARILRTKILGGLSRAQRPNDPDKLSYGSEYRTDFMGSDSTVTVFFSVETVVPVDVWSRRDRTDSLLLWIDRQAVKELYDDDVYMGPQSLLGVCSGAALSKYVIPQLLVLIAAGRGAPLPWDFKGVMIGVH